MADRFPHKTEEFDTTGEDSGVTDTKAGQKVIRTTNANLETMISQICDELKTIRQMLEGVL